MKVVSSIISIMPDFITTTSKENWAEAIDHVPALFRGGAVVFLSSLLLKQCGHILMVVYLRKFAG